MWADHIPILILQQWFPQTQGIPKNWGVKFHSTKHWNHEGLGENQHKTAHSWPLLIHLYLQILNESLSFYALVIGTPNWPSASTKHTTLFLLKLYLSNNYLKVNNLEEHLGAPLKWDPTHMYLAINRSWIQWRSQLLNSKPKYLWIRYCQWTAKNFCFGYASSYLSSVSLLDIWRHHKEKLKKITAAQN